MKTDNQSKERTVMRVSINNTIANLILAVMKLFSGIFANSGAMLSDAVHSIADIFITGIVMIGVKISSKDSDESHPYGHERFESVAALILSIVLCITGFGIGYTGFEKVLAADYENLPVPGVLALAVAILSLISKEAMYWYTKSVAKKINSGALMADAWHHRSDSLSAVGSFLGIFGARLGFAVFDPIASIIICMFILKAALNIFIDSINKMTDKSCDTETVNSIRLIAMRQKNVLGVDSIKTRIFGEKIYVDIEIQADGDASLTETYKISESVHTAVEEYLPKIKHCTVHVKPWANPNDKAF